MVVLRAPSEPVRLGQAGCDGYCTCDDVQRTGNVLVDIQEQTRHYLDELRPVLSQGEGYAGTASLPFGTWQRLHELNYWLNMELEQMRASREASGGSCFHPGPMGFSGQAVGEASTSFGLEPVAQNSIERPMSHHAPPRQKINSEPQKSPPNQYGDLKTIIRDTEEECRVHDWNLAVLQKALAKQREDLWRDRQVAAAISFEIHLEGISDLAPTDLRRVMQEVFIAVRNILQVNPTVPPNLSLHRGGTDMMVIHLRLPDSTKASISILNRKITMLKKPGMLDELHFKGGWTPTKPAEMGHVKFLDKVTVTARSGVYDLGLRGPSQSRPPSVFDVKPSGWAEALGIRDGDFIPWINSRTVAQMDHMEFESCMRSRPLILDVYRESDLKSMARAEDRLTNLADRVLRHAYAHESGSLGLTLKEVPNGSGIFVDVDSRGWAAKHGIKYGDELVRVNGCSTRDFSPQELSAVLLHERPISLTFAEPLFKPSHAPQVVEDPEGHEDGPGHHDDIKKDRTKKEREKIPDEIPDESAKRDSKRSSNRDSKRTSKRDSKRVSKMDSTKTVEPLEEQKKTPPPVTQLRKSPLGLFLKKGCFPPQRTFINRVIDGGWSQKQGCVEGTEIVSCNGELLTSMTASDLKEDCQDRPVAFVFVHPDGSKVTATFTEEDDAAQQEAIADAEMWALLSSQVDKYAITAMGIDFKNGCFPPQTPIIFQAMPGTWAEKQGLCANVEMIKINGQPTEGMDLGKFQDWLDDDVVDMTFRFPDGRELDLNFSVSGATPRMAVTQESVGELASAEKRRVPLGFYLKSNCVPPQQCFIKRVVANGWACNGGVQQGTEIVSVNGKPISSLDKMSFKTEADKRPCEFTFKEKDGRTFNLKYTTADEDANFDAIAHEEKWTAAADAVDEEAKTRMGLDFRTGSMPPAQTLLFQALPKSWAAKLGLEPDTELVEVNGKKTQGMPIEEFKDILAGCPVSMLFKLPNGKNVDAVFDDGATKAPAANDKTMQTNTEQRKKIPLGFICKASCVPPARTIVKRAVPGGWAATMGVRADTEILSINGKNVSTLDVAKFKEECGKRPALFKFKDMDGEVFEADFTEVDEQKNIKAIEDAEKWMELAEDVDEGARSSMGLDFRHGCMPPHKTILFQSLPDSWANEHKIPNDAELLKVGGKTLEGMDILDFQDLFETMPTKMHWKYPDGKTVDLVFTQADYDKYNSDSDSGGSDDSE